ncbi:hypothetical protein [Streptomyces subrutilus]|uniref:hypothetical protein n=1 Tax=Streptomyces subrutilus TaxID=36818 RepID=UPI002E0E1E36|nr:hypothetical protein OG479_33055 [Streptomyces subrutilus]
MGSDGTVLGVVIAVVGVIGSVLVARVSAPRSQPAGHPEPPDEGAPALEVSPEIFQHFSGRIRGLEDKVDHLTDLVEAQTVRVSTLEKLLRMAMRIVRRANRRLRAAELEVEPIPAELIPYSIE